MSSRAGKPSWQCSSLKGFQYFGQDDTSDAKQFDALILDPALIPENSRVFAISGSHGETLHAFPSTAYSEKRFALGSDGSDGQSFLEEDTTLLQQREDIVFKIVNIKDYYRQKKDKLEKDIKEFKPTVVIGTMCFSWEVDFYNDCIQHIDLSAKPSVRQRSPRRTPSTLSPGVRVKVRSNNDEVNGKTGIIKEKRETGQADRWTVQMDDGKEIFCKGDNLEIL